MNPDPDPDPGLPEKSDLEIIFLDPTHCIAVPVFQNVTCEDSSFEHCGRTRFPQAVRANLDQKLIS